MRLREHPRLVAISALLAALESVAILALGPRPAVALAPQVAALPPFGVFHDLRWLLVYHQSWLMFVLEAVLFLGARSGLETVLVRAAWPRDVPLPPWRDHAVATARFTAISALLLLPFAVLLFAMAVTSLSWLFFVAVPVLLMVALLVHHGAVDPRWWRDPPVQRGIVAVLIAFGLLTVAGAIVDPLPDWLIPFVAAAAGVGLAWCRLRVVGALAGRMPAPRRRPFVLVGLASVAALVVGGTAIGFGVAVAVEDARTPLPEASADATGPPVLIVKGFNSTWDGVTRQWVKGNWQIRRFSYRGLDESGKPRIYERDATHASVQVLAREMRRQVDAFHDATGQRVNIVAESEGALIAQAFLAGTPHAPVRSLVLLSPLLEPGRVDYPELGHPGWGIASGTVMDGIAAALGAVSPVDVSADTPLFRSIVSEAPPLRSLLQCPAPGVREFAVLPLDSGVSAPPPIEVSIPHAVVPAFHGGLLGDHTSAELLRHVLRGEPATGSSFWSGVADVVNAGGAAWQAPDLVTSLVPRWHSLPEADDCAAVRAELRHWLGP
jgi:hypothetical protein